MRTASRAREGHWRAGAVFSPQTSLGHGDHFSVCRRGKEARQSEGVVVAGTTNSDTAACSSRKPVGPTHSSAAAVASSGSYASDDDDACVDDRNRPAAGHEKIVASNELECGPGCA